MTTQFKQDLLIFLRRSLRNEPVEPHGESIGAYRVARRGHGMPLFVLANVAQMAKSSGFILTANGSHPSTHSLSHSGPDSGLLP
eukprot:SAG31_NODE_10108_length_1180_cov_1.951941_1_plen_83_part_10